MKFKFPPTLRLLHPPTYQMRLTFTTPRYFFFSKKCRGEAVGPIAKPRQRKN